MCGIFGILNENPLCKDAEIPLNLLEHRGPDDHGHYIDKNNKILLGHTRLSIIDVSKAGHQPMLSNNGDIALVFNGEIYNSQELKVKLNTYQFKSNTDTEVIIAAYLKWGIDCLEHFNGMFAFVLWDNKNKRVFGARDRFGVKPLYYHLTGKNSLFFASEIEAIHKMGVPKFANDKAWYDYLGSGLHDHNNDTFWHGIHKIPAGGYFIWTQKSGLNIYTWYDLESIINSLEIDHRPDIVIVDELHSLLEDSVNIRLRSDVEIGVALSGGLDSSLLASLISNSGKEKINSYTYNTGNSKYDEDLWVDILGEKVALNKAFCTLNVEEVPSLFKSVSKHQYEPFGGFPTLAMHKLMGRASADGMKVMLDGNGLDEGWGGYEYYNRAERVNLNSAPVQGSKSAKFCKDLMASDFKKAYKETEFNINIEDSITRLQYRDIKFTKLPRALRFTDNVSMASGIELRSPFLDYRVVELGLRQTRERKIYNGRTKCLVRALAKRLIPKEILEQPKRPVQTPQREWLRNDLSPFVDKMIMNICDGPGSDFLEYDKIVSEYSKYKKYGSDNSFTIYQIISLGMLSDTI